MYSSLSIQLSSMCTVLLNCILFNLTLKHTPKQMSCYSRVIRVHCVLDSLIVLKIFFSLNHPLILNGNLYMITFSPLHKWFPDFTSLVLYSYPWGIQYLIGVVPVDFVYRYLTVCKLKTLTLKHLTGVVAFICFVAFLETFPLIYSMQVGPSAETKTETQELLRFVDRADLVPQFLVISTHHPCAIFSMLVMLLTVLADYAVILFTVHAITSTANNSIAIRNSNVSKQIHHHILRVLVIQSTIPLIICIPIVFILLQEFFAINVAVFLSDFSMIGTWYTFLKCLATILVVPSYREAFLGVFLMARCERKKVQDVETIEVREST